MITLTLFLGYYTNRHTVDNYRALISAYLQGLYPEMPSRDLETSELYSRRYLDELVGGRDYVGDLKRSCPKIADRFAPYTANGCMQIVMLWLAANGYSLDRWQRKFVLAGLPAVRPITREREMSRKMWRQIYYAMPRETGMLLLLLLGSGLRIGEGVQLRRDDIDMTQRPTRVTVRAEISKTRMQRMTYMSAEAAAAVSACLSDRRDDDPRIYPWSADTAQYHLRRALRTLDLEERDPRTGMRSIHWHMTRKWFLTRFSLVSNRGVAEALAGHEGYLDAAYRRLTVAQMMHAYAAAERKISILKK